MLVVAFFGATLLVVALPIAFLVTTADFSPAAAPTFLARIVLPTGDLTTAPVFAGFAGDLAAGFLAAVFFTAAGFPSATALTFLVFVGLTLAAAGDLVLVADSVFTDDLATDFADGLAAGFADDLAAAAVLADGLTGLLAVVLLVTAAGFSTVAALAFRAGLTFAADLIASAFGFGLAFDSPLIDVSAFLAAFVDLFGLLSPLLSLDLAGMVIDFFVVELLVGVFSASVRRK